MKFKDILKQGVSAGMTFVGFSTMTVLTFHGFDPIPFILGGVVPFVGGGSLLHHFRKQYKLKKHHEIEQQVLELFTVYQGQMTIAQMAMALKLPVEVIENEMNRLQTKGVVEVNLTDNGVIVYKLPQLQTQNYDYLNTPQ